jgi:cytochrome c oxidase subunit 1
MSTDATTPQTPEPQPVFARENYLNKEYGLKSWLLTTDHKRIAVLFLISISVMFVLGGLAASVIRVELATPEGDVVGADGYNQLFTAHGVLLIFFFLVPGIPSVFGNFVLPMMLGARDLAFPRINLLSWYLYVLGAIITLWAMLGGGLDTGWTFYPPFSSKASTSNVVPTAIGLLIAGFSSILTGLNFVVTTHTMRAQGMTWFRMPLFVWSIYATSIIQLLATPVLAMAIILVGIERVTGRGIFDPALAGDPVLFQHLFWFYSHPAVYIMLLPGMAVISEVIPCFSLKNIFGYGFIALSSIAIAVFGFLVWGHHMFVAGQSIYASLTFSLLSYFVAVPSAIKVFNWTATLYKGSISFGTPMLFALGFVGLFTIGGLTGLFLACIGTDVHMTDTYFVVAHFHFIMVGATVMAYMAALHYWWPKITGFLFSDRWGKLSAALIFSGFLLTFMPQFLLGYQGMTRRYYQYDPQFQVLNVMSSAGATALAVGYVIPLIYLLGSLRQRRPAGPNPWRATGLEWQTASPPPTENFPVAPRVTTGPYEYSQMPEEEHVG